MTDTTTAAPPILEVKDLTCRFTTDAGTTQVLSDIDLTLERGVTLGVVGESGSGKSMLMKSILGIAPQSAAVGGTVVLDGQDLGKLPPRERQKVIGRRVGIVFQNPMSSLNPVVKVGRQVEEAARYHLDMDRREARALAIRMLSAVGLPDPEECLGAYPHQFSGGMKQRIMIAMALTCEPDLIIADEATTALDVTVQKTILDLLWTIQQQRGMSLILVTHNLGIVAGRADEIAVMYGGRIVERGPTRAIFRDARHRYTEALMAAIPRTDMPAHSRLRAIPGRPPVRLLPKPGCPFAPRCDSAIDLCHTQDPPVGAGVDPTHTYACFVPAIPTGAALTGGER